MAKLTEPRISIALPVYNAAAYLDQAIESISGQSFRDFELICIDDGSTDGSLNILQQWQKRDSRIIVKSRENRGIVATLNEALDRSAGGYFARMDADDISLPDRLSAQVNFMDMDPDIVLSGGNAIMIDPAGRPLKAVDPPLSHSAIWNLLLKGQATALIHPTIMAKTCACRKIGGYREAYRYVEDLDIFLRIGKLGNLANVPDTLLYYRQHLTSSNRLYGEQQWKLKRQLLLEIGDDEGADASDPPASSTEANPSRVDEVYRERSCLAFQGGNPATGYMYAVKYLLSLPWTVSRFRDFAQVIRLGRSYRSQTT